MKHILLSVIIGFTVIACQSNKLIDAAAYNSPSGLLAKWKLISYENSKLVTFDSYITITKNTQAANLYTINGKGPVNFFWVNCEIDSQNNALKMGSINGTQIAIKTSDEPLENDLLARFADSTIYQLSGDGLVLIFYNTTRTKSLTFKLIQS